MLKAFKYRIYPTKEQQELLAKTFGCCRFIYNYYLDKKTTAYEMQQKSLSYKECSNDMTLLKNSLPWLKEVDSVALQQSLKDLDKAFSNFFHGAGYPRFKSKRDNFYSYRTQMVNNNIQMQYNKIKLPKLNWVKYKNSRDISGKIKNITVSKTNIGKYYVSVCCETDIQKLPKSQNKIGIDVGIKNFCTISNGEKIENPQCLVQLDKLLKRAQRQLSSKHKGSNNYKKAKLRLAKILAV